MKSMFPMVQEVVRTDAGLFRNHNREKEVWYGSRAGEIPATGTLFISLFFSL